MCFTCVCAGCRAGAGASEHSLFREKVLGDEEILVDQVIRKRHIPCRNGGLEEGVRVSLQDCHLTQL